MTGVPGTQGASAITYLNRPLGAGGRIWEHAYESYAAADGWRRTGDPYVVSVCHDPDLLDRLSKKGIGKFVAYEVPLELARQRYANHFVMVEQGLKETDDLRVLDFDGQRAFKLFRFAEMGAPIVHEDGASA